MPYTINPNPHFERSYKRLPKDVRRHVQKTVNLLRENPHHPSLRTHKRQGEEGVWQARVTRSYRIYFSMEGDIIRLLDVTAHEK